MDVEITNADRPKLYHILVSKESESFPLPSDTAPLMVLFDKGTQILKSVEFKKDKKEWLYQLKNAAEVADRADAAVALGKIKNDDEVVAALGDALRTTRLTACASPQPRRSANSAALLPPSNSSIHSQPSPRSRGSATALSQALGNFKDDAAIDAKLEAVARDDSSYRARAAALQALGRMKAPMPMTRSIAAVTAIRPMDSCATPLCVPSARSATTKPCRFSAIGPRPAKTWIPAKPPSSAWPAFRKTTRKSPIKLPDISRIPTFRIRLSAIFALGSRGDASAIPALEALLKSNDLSIEMAPMIKGQIERLKNPKAKGRPCGEMEEEGGADAEEASAKPAEDQRLSHLEQLVQEMNDRLKSMESRLPPAPPPNK